MIKHLLLLLGLLLACHCLVAAERPTVILLSDESEAYQLPIAAFKAKHDRDIVEYNLRGNINTAPQIMTKIMNRNPALIFALGAKAAWFAKAATKHHQETKVIFAMVLNWQRYHLLDGQGNITGISADIAPGTQLFNLSLLAPQAKRVGVIYSPRFSKETIHKAQVAAELVGLQLVIKPIDQAQEFQRAWRQISNNIDAYWVLTDPVLYTMENIHWLNERCIKEAIVCIGQSDNIAKLGLLFSVNPDVESIGNQAAALAQKVIKLKSIDKASAINDPIGTKITLNAVTANKIGLKIPANALTMVNEVINE